MSRITNLSNLRIKRFNTWKSNWVENNKNYSLLFFYDFQLHQYLRGLFYRLKILTDDFYIDHLLNNFLYIKVNAFFYKFNIYNYVLNYFFDQYLFYDFFFFFLFF